MTEERRYLTHEDIPDIQTPCYITSTGELWQWSNRKKALIQKTPFYDRFHDKSIVNVATSNEKYKNGARTIAVATYVYRYFSGDENLPKQINIAYRDGDPMNCNIDNLFIRSERFNKNPRVRRVKVGGKVKKVRVKPDEEETNEIGLQVLDKKLLLSDFDSVLVFLDMQREHRDHVYADTQLTIDTTEWTAEQLRKLLKIRARLGDAIIK